MTAHKHITKIIAVVMAAAVCLCLCAVVFSDQIAAAAGDTGISMEYETALFDTGSIISVNIRMDEADWSDMLSNAAAEEYYECDAEINGTTFYRVGIRPKGNTSLTSIASDPTTDRYSFKLEFDHYVDGQTCFGLDKLILNNNYADATNMKEALIYDMYQYLGADASLCNYAKISVNGKYWGVYLALEAVEDSFLLRNYGAESGALYKPDSMNMGGGFDTDDMDFGGMDFNSMTPPDRQEPGDPANMPQFPSRQPNENNESTAEPPANSGERPEMSFDFAGGVNGFSMSGGGADLNYTDDELDSYETIWDGEVTSTKKSDHKRVVTALRNISEGNDLESYMDIDNLLRYMAVHVFSVNEDSLSGMMAHNYYLYESGGELNIIPWDYNLCLGGMGSSNDAASVVNDAIDNAFSGTTFFDSLLADETYHSQYYAYLQQLVSEYIDGGGFDAFYERVRGQIDVLVETDPTAFYSYEEYLTAADTLYQVVKLRGQSIQGQLDGTIPSIAEEQRSSDTLVDASSLDISVMGSMNTGDGGFGFDRQAARFDAERGLTENNTDHTSEPSASVGAANDSRSDPEPPKSGDTPPGGFNASQSDGEVTEGFVPSRFGGKNQAAPDSGQTVPMNNLALYGLSLLVLIAAMLFAVLYRRKPRRR